MKVLSIKQPWAWAILYGGKDVENRTWSTKFRGRFLIHASKSFDQVGWQWIAENENRLGLRLPSRQSDFITGAIIGSVNLFDCRQSDGSRWFQGPYGFLLRNPIGIPFIIPCKGRLKFFDFDLLTHEAPANKQSSISCSNRKML